MVAFPPRYCDCCLCCVRVVHVALMLDLQLHVADFYLNVPPQFRRSVPRGRREYEVHKERGEEGNFNEECVLWNTDHSSPRACAWRSVFSVSLTLTPSRALAEHLASFLPSFLPYLSLLSLRPPLHQKHAHFTAQLRERRQVGFPGQACWQRQVSSGRDPD